LSGKRRFVRKSGTERQLFSGPDQTFPDIGTASWFGLEQEAFDGASGGPVGEEPGGQHAGVVANQCIAGAQELRQIRKNMVRQRVARPVDDQQTRLVAACSRRLRHQVRRKYVVEEIGGKRHGGT
jgi:hypothetical protein